MGTIRTLGTINDRGCYSAFFDIHFVTLVSNTLLKVSAELVSCSPYRGLHHLGSI